MSDISQNTHLLVCSDGVEMWVSQERAEAVKRLRERGKKEFNIDGNLVIVRTILGAQEAKERIHRKHGEWKCDQGAWHPARTVCNCNTLRERNANNQDFVIRQKEYTQTRGDILALSLDDRSARTRVFEFLYLAVTNCEPREKLITQAVNVQKRFFEENPYRTLPDLQIFKSLLPKKGVIDSDFRNAAIDVLGPCVLSDRLEADKESRKATNTRTDSSSATYA